MGIPSPYATIAYCIPLHLPGSLEKLVIGKSGEEAKKPRSNILQLTLLPSMNGTAKSPAGLRV